MPLPHAASGAEEVGALATLPAVPFEPGLLLLPLEPEPDIGGTPPGIAPLIEVPAPAAPDGTVDMPAVPTPLATEPAPAVVVSLVTPCDGSVESPAPPVSPASTIGTQ
jgi:hypothetical protein